MGRQTGFIDFGAGSKNHLKKGGWQWDPSKVELYLTDRQKACKPVMAGRIFKQFEAGSMFNDKALDYLIAHEELIPGDWKKDATGKTLYIMFPGTVCNHSVTLSYVRCLYFEDERWQWRAVWSDDYLTSEFRTAQLKK